MARADDLKRLLQSGKKKPEKEAEPKEAEEAPEKEEPQKKEEPESTVDVEALSKIVDRMRSKYIEEGTMKEAGGEEADRLRRMIEARPEQIKIGQGKAADLSKSKKGAVRTLGKVYSGSGASAFSGIANVLGGKNIDQALRASGSGYTGEQYTALVMSATLLVWLVSLGLMFLLVFMGKMPIIAAVLGAVIVPIIVPLIAFMIPKSRATKIAGDIDKQLPFALRHMSIEIRAGVGIYKTMESVAGAGYGPLSDGFRNVLLAVEKGVPTEEALTMWAAGVKSEALNRVVSHIVRALRTGGSLSDIMVTIAEDVSFERKMKIADYAEKLNLMSLFLMMVAIVLPIMLGILTAIGATPSIKEHMAMLSGFSIETLTLVYLLVCPMLIFIFIFYIRSADPGA